MTDTGTLFIISAPSGTGKTSLVTEVIKNLDNIVVSISYTTRPKRKREEHGKHYYFVDDATFQAMIKQELFLEHANVFGNFYGTSKLWIDNELKKNNDVILAIDWQGAVAAKAKVSNAISIFILPPSLEALQQRLIDRKQDSNDVIEKRMAQAKANITHYKDYEYIIINDSFDRARDDLIAIIKARRLNISVKSNAVQSFVNKLIS